MTKPRLLLSGLGGSLFPYLHDKLENKYDLFYVDSDHSLKEVYPYLNFYPAPLVTDRAYPAFIEHLIRENSINVYAPLIDEEIEVAHKICNQNGALKLISPTLSFCRLAMRKDLLMSELDRLGISSIPTWTGHNFTYKQGVDYFVKPISGRGSRGIRKITNESELEAYYTLERFDKKDVLIQECIRGQEYTVGALTNKFNELIYCSSRKILSKKGITIKAITENNELIFKIVKRINESLKPQGPINVQLYLTENGEIKIFEINPRFSTTTIMSYEAGVDEIGLLLEFSDKRYDRNTLMPKPGLILKRRWENVFYERN